jgi:hypothetical protein
LAASADQATTTAYSHVEPGAPEPFPVDETKLRKSSRLLVNYCESRELSLEYHMKGRQVVNGRDVWTESVVVGGKHRADGLGWSSQGAQDAAALALVDTGLLEDFPLNE